MTSSSLASSTLASTPTKKPARRTFLAGAAAGTAAMAAPMVSVAQSPIIFRFQSTWPARDIFHEYANDFARKVNEMSGGRMRIEVLPAGAIVPAFQLIDAVGKGTVDGGHGVVAYWYDKNSAFSLWGSGPAFGMDANVMLAWHYYGGGKELLDEIYKSMKLDVVSMLYGPMPTQPLGWFKKPVTKPADFKGLKYRTVGLAVDVFKLMGAEVNPLPGGEIIPALNRGMLDAAEFNNVSSDRSLGFPEVAKNCMLQSFHQASEQFEILFNRQKYASLSGELRAIIDYAMQAASADMSWKSVQRNSKDYAELREQGISFYKTPDAVLRAQLEAWDQVTQRKSAENPLFKRILDSQRAFAERAVRWQTDTMVDYKMAYNHYFARPTKTAVATTKKR